MPIPLRRQLKPEKRGVGIFSDLSDEQVKSMREFSETMPFLYGFIVSYFEKHRSGSCNIAMNAATLKSHEEQGRGINYYQGYSDACGLFTSLFGAVENEWKRRLACRAIDEKSDRNR